MTTQDAGAPPPAPTLDSAGPVAPTDGATSGLRPVPFGSVRITGGMWAQRQETNRTVTIPSGRERLERAGNLDNLRIASGQRTGQARGPVFMDSDVYKWLEAVAWEYGRRPSADLLAMQREVTAPDRCRAGTRRLPQLGRADPGPRSLPRTCREATSTTAQAT